MQTLSPTAAAAMKIITQLVILTLSLLLVNAHDNRQYCTNLINKFKEECTIKSCYHLNYFSSDYVTSKVSSGVYKMSSSLTNFGNSVDAYCDMTTDGGGWIVIQRKRKDNVVSFNKNWTDYEEGFGDLNTDFWYGLKIIHSLTQRGQWEMRLDYQYENKQWSYLHYNQFSVGSASKEYPLTVGGFTGVGRDLFALRPLNGKKFSTPDNDNDKSSGNCAAVYKSGWWYSNDCFHIDINRQPPYIHYSNALFVEMKIRPKDCITQ